jgi:hypothetical protein
MAKSLTSTLVKRERERFAMPKPVRQPHFCARGTQRARGLSR